MAQILHILTRDEDRLAEEVIDAQKELGEHTLSVFNLNAENPDYGSLLKAIFAADSVEVW